MVGVGGQGILLATQIAARAALIIGHDVKTNEVHGMAQRGGSVVAQIRFGEKVYSPLVSRGHGAGACVPGADRGAALCRLPRAGRSGRGLQPGDRPGDRFLGPGDLPGDAEERLRAAFPRLAYIDAVGVAESICDTRVANVILLGAMSTALDLPAECWEEAIAQCVKPKFLPIMLERSKREGGRPSACSRAPLPAPAGFPYCITDSRSL